MIGLLQRLHLNKPLYKNLVGLICLFCLLWYFIFAIVNVERGIT